MSDPAFASNLAAVLVRVPIGCLFACAGWSKLQGGVGNFVKGAIGSVPKFVPHWAGNAYLYALPFAELSIGFLVAVGLFARPAAVVMSLMLVSFMIAVTGFGSAEMPVHPNVIYLGIALAVALLGPGRYSADAVWRKR